VHSPRANLILQSISAMPSSSAAPLRATALVRETPVAAWSPAELCSLAMPLDAPLDTSYDVAFSKFNPTPGLPPNALPVPSRDQYSRSLLSRSPSPSPSVPSASPPPFWLSGTGRTGVYPVAPNNYPFYTAEEVYAPAIQSDGGQLSGAFEAML
jgi:hypothetical protein